MRTAIEENSSVKRELVASFVKRGYQVLLQIEKATTYSDIAKIYLQFY